MRVLVSRFQCTAAQNEGFCIAFSSIYIYAVRRLHFSTIKVAPIRGGDRLHLYISLRTHHPDSLNGWSNKMEIVTREKPPATIVSVKGRIDAMTSAEFETHLSSLRRQDKIQLIINLSDLEYISSAGLRVILSAAKDIKAGKGHLLFCGLKGAVKEIFEISGFCSILSVCNSEDEALAKI